MIVSMKGTERTDGLEILHGKSLKLHCLYFVSGCVCARVQVCHSACMAIRTAFENQCLSYVMRVLGIKLGSKAWCHLLYSLGHLTGPEMCAFQHAHVCVCVCVIKFLTIGLERWLNG